MKKKIWIWSSILGFIFTSVLAVSVVLPLWIVKKSTDVMQYYVPIGGPSNKLYGKTPIKYVALGDSITAGFNGHYWTGKDSRTTDYISYADFLARSLKKAKLLESYKNYAVSGSTIHSVNDMIKNPGVIKNLYTADLITLTVGSNDILKGVTFFGLPFGFSLEAMLGEFLSNPSKARHDLFPDAYESLTREEFKDLIEKVISNIIQTNYDKDGKNKLKLQKIISFQEGLETIFPRLIKRDLLTLIVTLSKLAPNARIKFILPENPFLGFPKSFLNSPVGKTSSTIISMFLDFKSQLAEGAKANYVDVVDSSKSFQWYVNYLKEIDAKKLNFPPELKAEKEVLLEHASRIKKYAKQKKSDQEFISHFFMNNLPDIHPTVFAHEALGNYLFSNVIKEQGQIKTSLDNLYTFAFPHDSIYSTSDRIKEVDQIDATNIDTNFNPSKLADKKYNGFMTVLSKLIREILEGKKNESPLVYILTQMKPFFQNFFWPKDVKKYKLKKGEGQIIYWDNPKIAIKKTNPIWKIGFDLASGSSPLGRRFINILNYELIFNTKNIKSLKKTLFGSDGLLTPFSHKRTIKLPLDASDLEDAIEQILVENKKVKKTLNNLILLPPTLNKIDMEKSSVSSIESIDLEIDSLKDNLVVKAIKDHNEKVRNSDSSLGIEKIVIENIQELFDIINYSLVNSKIKTSFKWINAAKTFNTIGVAQKMKELALEDKMPENYISALNKYIKEKGESKLSIFTPGQAYDILYEEILGKSEE